MRHLLSYLALLSAAVTLSTVLPSPWTIFRETNTTNVKLERVQRDPALEWKDNIWPIRRQTPWDISTDFPHPRKLEYDVQEGTWLHLDVHPTSGDVVFDMVGDIYCLPGAEALYASNDGPVNARPILQGVPYDSNPRFSPEGDRLVFRSDAELGVDNIWIMEWNGCDAMNLKRPDLRHVLDAKDAEEELLAQGIKEDEERKYNRLSREGRFGALRVTNETYRSVIEARFHPSGSKIIATKLYTSERSLGAGEGWEYQTPSLDDLRSQNARTIPAGSGKVLVGRTLPRGWTVEQYADQQIGQEQYLWKGNDTLIFSKNVVDEFIFTFNKDVHTGTYAIFARSLTTGVTETVVNSLPGGASRPELSRDGRTLAFVRRVRDKEALVFK
jgi:dipeptidyl aminopeptidase/acylaminoacyl peptidase